MLYDKLKRLIDSGDIDCLRPFLSPSLFNYLQVYELYRDGVEQGIKKHRLIKIALVKFRISPRTFYRIVKTMEAPAFDKVKAKKNEGAVPTQV